MARESRQLCNYEAIINLFLDIFEIDTIDTCLASYHSCKMAKYTCNSIRTSKCNKSDGMNIIFFIIFSICLRHYHSWHHSFNFCTTGTTEVSVSYFVSTSDTKVAGLFYFFISCESLCPWHKLSTITQPFTHDKFLQLNLS